MSRLVDHAVIGSGLSAIGSIRALIKHGLKPVVIDVGRTLPGEKQEFSKKLALKDPSFWTEEERTRLSFNISVEENLLSIPEKKVYGSDFFYGSNEPRSELSYQGIKPPFSFAKGGLAEGWGASTLPPSKDDILDWPITYKEIIHYYKEVIDQLSFSAVKDDLDKEFPVLHKSPISLDSSPFDKKLLSKLENISKRNPNILCGQARLVVNASESSPSGCKKCGECMSGCVFGSIYKPSSELDELIKNGKVEYLSQLLVTSIEKNQREILKINYLESSGKKGFINAKRIYLAAGAVNSSRIILNSLRTDLKRVSLQTRGGYVVPSLSFSRIGRKWPKANTLPAIFIEQKNSFLQSWSHIQVSTNNELLHRRTSSLLKKIKSLRLIIRFFFTRVFTLFVSYHSKHSGRYILSLEILDPKDENPKLNSLYILNKPKFTLRIFSFFELFSLFLKARILILLPFSRLNSGTYHVGGSLPMKSNPKAKNDTDLYGQISQLKRVHIVDSSIFPSLPATTIGILSMANAYRITEKTCLEE